METRDIRRLLGFYRDQLQNEILYFWLPRCEDKKYGGFLNCFTNRGDRLVSTDKYTWSQGRFVWMFAKLSRMENTFSRAQRSEFLRLAVQGADFLMAHCLLPDEPTRCTFLMDETGAAKLVDGGERLDMSIYADCFVIAGLGRLSGVLGTAGEAYFAFAKHLYESAVSLWKAGTFQTLPYPLSPAFKAHGIPMIFQNVARELHEGAKILDPDFDARLLCDMNADSLEILEQFADENGHIREVIRADGTKLTGLVGEHINPGHTIEDVWFHMDTAELTGHPERLPLLSKIALAALETGWDTEMGGLLHFASLCGGQPAGEDGDAAGETMLAQAKSGWGDKLWWEHAEALYTTLRMYFATNDERFMDWHNKVFDYTYATFPNPDRELREWIQICTREGKPQDKVVALPVKDPYHITRNLALLIDLLEAELAKRERVSLSVPYGSAQEAVFTLPKAGFQGVLHPAGAEAAADPAAALREAIDHPIGSPTLAEIVKNAPADPRVCIICDDISRPTPVSTILPVMLERLESAGVRPQRIKIVMALGSHRYMTEDEIRTRVGAAIYARYKVVNSEFRDPEKLVFVGTTADGVDIVVCREVMDSDIRIGIGNIVPHPVMGWSGGGKILFPGVTAEKTVAQFHMLGGLSNERLVGVEDNPVRLRMESWVETIGLHFIVNTVLDEAFRIVKVVAGHYVSAHREGVRWAKQLMSCPIPRKADVIVVSSYPADEDFWQSPKGMINAEGGLRNENSTLILVSPNWEGMGPHDEYGACTGMNPDEAHALLKRVHDGEPVPGDPLALAVGTSMAKMRRRCRMVVVSDGVTREEIEACGMEYYPLCALQEAIDTVLARYDTPVTAAVRNGGELLVI